MTTLTDICNRSLQVLGTRTTVSDAELATNGSNEAIQFNLIYANLRDGLLRMAPWDCAMKVANLAYITSQPGTPENTSPATQLWTPGQPPPPWAYEYQYPVDCVRAIQIIPANQTGFAGSTPITTAVTGGASAWWWGAPVRFKVQTDTFIPVTAASVAAGGSGYAVGDIITLASGLTTNPPIGAPAQLTVLTAPGGVVATVGVVNVIKGASPAVGGSYFAAQTNPVAQGSTTGLGTGATFNLTFGTAGVQRVVLTNQEFATLIYIQQITDPNVMDDLFQKAWTKLLGAEMCMALTGKRDRANDLIQSLNQDIQSARSIDGNEGFDINDVTPDWIRIRGVAYSDGYVSGPYSGYDFGGVWPLYI